MRARLAINGLVGGGRNGDQDKADVRSFALAWSIPEESLTKLRRDVR